MNSVEEEAQQEEEIAVLAAAVEHRMPACPAMLHVDVRPADVNLEQSAASGVRGFWCATR